MKIEITQNADLWLVKLKVRGRRFFPAKFTFWLSKQELKELHQIIGNILK